MTEPDDVPENNSAVPEPGPAADRWAHLRNTCPHGIVRGLITCPVCEPDKQAAAEASARAAVEAAQPRIPQTGPIVSGQWRLDEMVRESPFAEQAQALLARSAPTDTGTEPVDTITVRVRDRRAETPWGSGHTDPRCRNVVIAAACPVCGGPRGKPYLLYQHDDGATYHVDKWDNPCGHVDLYEAVILEAARLTDTTRNGDHWPCPATKPNSNSPTALTPTAAPPGS